MPGESRKSFTTLTPYFQIKPAVYSFLSKRATVNILLPSSTIWICCISIPNGGVKVVGSFVIDNVGVCQEEGDDRTHLVMMNIVTSLASEKNALPNLLSSATLNVHLPQRTADADSWNLQSWTTLRHLYCCSKLTLHRWGSGSGHRGVGWWQCSSRGRWREIWQWDCEDEFWITRIEYRTVPHDTQLILTEKRVTLITRSGKVHETSEASNGACWNGRGWGDNSNGNGRDGGDTRELRGTLKQGMKSAHTDGDDTHGPVTATSLPHWRRQISLHEAGEEKKFIKLDHFTMLSRTDNAEG